VGISGRLNEIGDHMNKECCSVVSLLLKYFDSLVQVFLLVQLMYYVITKDEKGIREFQ
jgi:hypothetical protein